jgi:hypothetical protein
MILVYYAPKYAGVSLFLLTLTLPADTKYLHPVPNGGRIMLLGQPFLQMFNFWTQHLNNPAAFKANQMVMVLMLVFMPPR